MIHVTEHTAKWLLHEAERNLSFAFTAFPPHACKLCDEPTVPGDQPKHVKAHWVELEKAAEKRRRESLRALKQANRLRREANHAA